MGNQDMKFLKDHIKAEIVKGGIIDPNDHNVDQIIGSYFREIMWLARRYVRPTVEFEDLVVEGLIGLLDAIKRFDKKKSKGNRRAFHNLAIVRIKSMMFEYLLTNGSVYHIPNYMARAISLVNQVRTILNTQEYPGDPQADLLSLEESVNSQKLPTGILKNLKLTKEKIRKLAKNADKTYEDMVKVVLRVERDIESYENQEDDTENPEEEVSQREFLGKFLFGLKEDARDVMRLRLEGKTLDEAGIEMGFTRERARQIEEETVDFFRDTRMYLEATEN